MPDTPLHQLSTLGQSVWLDFVSRDFVEDGELERAIAEDAVVGITSNPTIFQQAIAAGDRYDEQFKEVLASTEDPKEVFLALAVRDIRGACDVLRPVWERTDGRDGFVSLEVDPTLAHDAEATLAEAARLKAEVDRDNLLVKIPATMEGLRAIEDATAQGIAVNVTLIFSLQRHALVCEAYTRGLERLVADGGDPTHVASVASFFVSRVDTEADKRLDAVGGPDELRGTLAIANARLAYEVAQQAFSGERWAALEAKGARPQRPLWASTSTKNPAYRDTMYIEELIGPGTVNTMPPETAKAFQDHGEVRGETLCESVEEARATLERFAAAGVDYDDVTATLEREGVEKFAKSFEELIEGVREKREQLAATPG